MRVPVGVRVGVFALAVMLAYTYYANSIPQIESRPPEVFVLEPGRATPAQLIRAGEEIFRTKGTCSVCHMIGGPGGRGPDLAGVGARAGQREPGKDATTYLVEALVQPAAFVVEGYPNIMPPVDRPPISLTRSEVWAVVAYLESLGGEVTVTLDDIPATVGAAAAPGAQPPPVTIPGDVTAGREIFAGKGGCIACHKAGDLGASPVGPDLSQIARIQTPDYIMRKILDPAGMGTVAGFPPGVMPPIYGQTLTAKEYTDLVAFLLTLQ